MYKFEGELIKKRNVKQKIDVPYHKLMIIIRAIKKTGSTVQALKNLKDNGVIDPSVHNQTYKRNLYKTPEYAEIVQSKEEDRKERDKYIVSLRKKGLNYDAISRLTCLNYNTIYSICNKKGFTKKLKGKRKLTNNTAQSVVDYWNRTSFKGKVATKETLEAFELLGLEPPISQL